MMFERLEVQYEYLSLAFETVSIEVSLMQIEKSKFRRLVGYFLPSCT